MGALIGSWSRRQSTAALSKAAPELRTTTGLLQATLAKNFAGEVLGPGTKVEVYTFGCSGYSWSSTSVTAGVPACLVPLSSGPRMEINRLMCCWPLGNP